MKKIRALWMRLVGLFYGGLFYKERRDTDLNAEIESHIQLHTDDNLRAGMSPEDARRDALLRFGGIESAKEDYRERRSLPLLETLIRDLLYGARSLRKNRGFTALAVATLALGIGGCAAMYAYVQQVILIDTPYPDLPSLVVVQEVDSLDAGSNRGVSAPAFTAIQNDSRYFEDIGGYTTDGFVLMENDSLPILEGAVATPNIFEVLGVKPLLGRTFLESEGTPGNNQVVVLSERAWKRYFAGKPNIVGSSIDLSRKLYTVIGVMPDGFWHERDVWIPVDMTPASIGRMRTWARLKQPGTYEQAQSELDVLSERLARDDPEAQGTFKLEVVNPFELSSSDLGMMSAFLIAPVGLVFLIACVNIAHLQLGRDIQRSREMALRLAIGASRARLTRQLLTESLLLALLGGAVGVVFAWWGINAIAAYLPSGSLELVGSLELDHNVLLFLLALSAGSSVVFGLLPAVRVSGLGLATALKEGSRHTSRNSFRNWLAISELALSTVLLVGTGIMVVMVQHVTHTDMGFDERDLWSARLSMRGPIRYDDAAKRNWVAASLEQIRALPGVASVAVASELPLLGGEERQFEAIGQARADGVVTQAEYRAVSPSYFEALRIPLRQGRLFQAGDRDGSTPIVILNETMARRFFPEGALGQRLRVFPEQGVQSGPSVVAQVREVVGIVADVRQTPVGSLPAPPIAYVPHPQDPIAPLSLVVRTQGSPDRIGRAVLDTIRAPSAQIILQSVMVFEREIADRVRARRFLPMSMAVFAAFGLILTAVGLYGTTSRAVAQRTQEFGLRQALGARASDVLRLVLGQSTLGGVIGLALGAVCSIAGATLLLQVLDPQERSAFNLLSVSEILFVGLAAATVLIAVILVATYFPARRATNVDPLTALRYE